MVLLALFLFFCAFFFLLFRKFGVSNRKIAWVYSFAFLGMSGCVEYHWGFGTLWQLLNPPESGVNIVHNKDGWVEYEKRYENDKEHGTSTRYYENGSVRSVRTFDHGTEIGKSEVFFKGKEEGKTGPLFILENFDEQGRRHGKWIYMKANGDPNSIHNFRHGKAVGLQTIYHGKWNDPVPRGFLNQKKTEAFFVEGLLDSIQTTWHENGQIRSKEYYVDSYRHGTWKYWDSNGKLIDSDVYEKSICIADCEGTCLSLHSGGTGLNKSTNIKNCEGRLKLHREAGEEIGAFDF